MIVGLVVGEEKGRKKEHDWGTWLKFREGRALIGNGLPARRLPAIEHSAAAPGHGARGSPSSHCALDRACVVALGTHQSQDRLNREHRKRGDRCEVTLGTAMDRLVHAALDSVYALGSCFCSPGGSDAVTISDDAGTDASESVAQLLRSN